MATVTRPMLKAEPLMATVMRPMLKAEPLKLTAQQGGLVKGVLQGNAAVHVCYMNPIQVHVICLWITFHRQKSGKY